jgi:hypothetical protein
MASVDRLTAMALAGKDGRPWYRQTADALNRIAVLAGVSPQRLADILAITSPRVSVKRNVRIALHYVLTGELLGSVLPAVKRALEHYERTGQIRGQKTAEFAIALTGYPDTYVLDVWMARAFGIPQTAFNRIGTRDKCVQRLNKVGERLGWPTSEVQAAIWYATFREHGRNPVPMPLWSVWMEYEQQLFKHAA